MNVYAVLGICYTLVKEKEKDPSFVVLFLVGGADNKP